MNEARSPMNQQAIEERGTAFADVLSKHVTLAAP